MLSMRKPTNWRLVFLMAYPPLAETSSEEIPALFSTASQENTPFTFLQESGQNQMILVPVIFLAVYYLFVMGRIVDRIVNVDAPAAKLAEQASIEMLEARRAARNYALLRGPEYLQTNQKSLTSVRQILVRIGDLEPGDKTIVQQGLEAVTLYQQRFAVAISTMAESGQEPVERIREAVLAYQKDLDDLVKASRHERRAQLIQELRTRVGSFDTQITQAIQVGSSALLTVTPCLL